MVAGKSFPVLSARFVRPVGIFGPSGDRCLRRSALRIATVEPIFDEQQHVAQSGSIRKKRSTGNLEMVGDDRNNHRQIKIRMKAPREIEIAFMRERWPRRRRNRS